MSLLGVWGDAPVGRSRRGGNTHLAAVAWGWRGWTHLTVRRRKIHPHHGHHRVRIHTGSLASLGSCLGLLGLGEGSGWLLLCPDDEGTDALLWCGGGDDEAEPDGEYDAKGDGGSGEPTRDAHSGVQAGYPVRPLPEERIKSCAFH